MLHKGNGAMLHRENREMPRTRDSLVLRYSLAMLLFIATGIPGCLSPGPAAPKVGEAAPDFELALVEGDKVKLSALAAESPVVLIVLRGNPGYQCPYCSTQFHRFLENAQPFKDAGTKVLFVYPGPSEKLKDHALAFAKGREVPSHIQIALDPDYVFTNAYGLRWNSANETAYPAAFVIDKNRKILFSKASMTHGNRIPPEELLKAIPGK